MTIVHFDHVKFLHPVGISTCKYGVTIPFEAQLARMLAIAKGEKVPVTILLGVDEPVLAEIRRLNNQLGHLQFRYEKKAQERLRQALARIFDGGVAGNLLEIEEIAPLVFRFKPILKTTSPRLQISDLLLHRVKQAEIDRIAEVGQIDKTLAGVAYDAGFSQSAYNGLIKERLQGQGWTPESRVVDDLSLRCDFEKNGVWVEVEFGNARSYYQDYIKFLLAKQYRSARLGLLLCPTASFAGLLCELGRKRAEENVVRQQAASYGGMMSFEKAARELPYLWFHVRYADCGGRGRGFRMLTVDMANQSNCPFCNLDGARTILANDHSLVIYDGFPISPGHALIIPKRHVASFFELTAEEQGAMLELLAEMRKLLQKEHNSDGFNIGINDGAPAGQTVMHLHIHLIPRYVGDMPDPRGGVRWIIPDKAAYWDK